MSTASALPSLIGVIHLPALAGAPGSSDPADALQRAGLQAVKEAQIFVKAGFDGIILENFGDVPFYKTQVPPETVASMSVIAAAVREAARKVSLGINVLRNDSRAALAIAAVTGCDFIRVNVLSGVSATDQGWIEGDAAFLLRERHRLGADHVAILGDVLVKHARSMSCDDITLAAEETALRSGADGIIVTGHTTGRPVDQQELMAAVQVARAHQIPVYVGSGANLKNLSELKKLGARVIVGSALRKGGRAGAPLDPKAVKAFATAFWRTPSKSKLKASKSKKKRPRQA